MQELDLGHQVTRLELAVSQLRQDLNKMVMAGGLDNRALASLNDLVGIQQAQIRDLGHQVRGLDKLLQDHLVELGVAE